MLVTSDAAPRGAANVPEKKIQCPHSDSERIYASLTMPANVLEFLEDKEYSHDHEPESDEVIPLEGFF